MLWCLRIPDHPIVGTWQFKDGTVEFRADGTLTVDSGQQQIIGVWMVQDGQITVTITLPDNTTQTTTCDYKIEHNTLTVTGD